MMSTDETSKKTFSRPQLVVLKRSFKLAEQWVSSQGNSLDDAKSNVVVLVSRPPRLGIGAIVPRRSETVRSNDPIERQLRSKLDAKKRKVLKNTEVSAKSIKDGRVDEDNDDEDLESKTKAFVKKKSAILSSFMQPNKKKNIVAQRKRSDSLIPIFLFWY